MQRTKSVKNFDNQPFYVPIAKRHLFRGINVRGYLPPLTYCVPDPIADYEDRIGNLEAISAEPGQIPWRYHDRLEQKQREVIYLQNKLNEGAVRKSMSNKAQYRGLKVART